MLKKFKGLIIIAGLILVYLPGFAKMQEMNQKLVEMRRDIEKAKESNVRMEERIRQMRSNQNYVEMVARERMGVVKKGETLIKFVPDDRSKSDPVAENLSPGAM